MRTTYLDEPLLIVDTRKLAHCRMCYEPMYCIYDQSIRDYCHECTQEMVLEEKAAS